MMIRTHNTMQQSRASRAQGGFTLVETLMALLILVIMTSIVAMGIPVAWDTYQKAVAGSNAQILLSTTTTELRNELGFAQSVKTDSLVNGGINQNGTVDMYQSGDGYWAKLDMDDITVDGKDVKAIVKHMYAGYIDETGQQLTEIGANPETLVSVHAADQLNVSYGTITYEDGVFKVKSLKVYMDDPSSPLASLDEYDVEAFMLIQP